MKPKIVIADDSQTIQKVIKITLASENFSLVECLEEEQLLKSVRENKPSLVLLDFNLSETKTGYDLAREIKEICNPRIMMLFGTFDVIEESLFEEVGVNGYIVKPFDGTKFINLCRQLVSDSLMEGSDVSEDTGMEEDLETQPEEVENSVVDDTIADEWTVNQPDLDNEDFEKIDVTDILSQDELSTLESGMADWGGEVPSIIGANKVSTLIELPPVIEPEKPVTKTDDYVHSLPSLESQNISEDLTMELDVEVPIQLEASVPVESLLPKDDDLEYPDLVSFSANSDIARKPQFDSISDLETLSEGEESTTRTISLDDTLGTSTDEEVKKLEEQIADEVNVSDEVEDISENTGLWKVDEVMSEASFDKESKSELAPQFEVSEEIIKEKIDKMLTPMVEKIVREKIDAIIEKISWEIIPDLAENLIRKELKQVSEDVLDSPLV